MLEYEVGQIWAVDAQSEVPPLLILIHRIDDEESPVASISIVPHPDAEKAGWPRVSHLPVALETLGANSGKLIDQTAPHNPSFEEGYTMWRVKFDAGEAGFFTLSASEAYSAVTGVTKSKKNNTE